MSRISVEVPLAFGSLDSSVDRLLAPDSILTTFVSRTLPVELAETLHVSFCPFHVGFASALASRTIGPYPARLRVVTTMHSRQTIRVQADWKRGCGRFSSCHRFFGK